MHSQNRAGRTHFCTNSEPSRMQTQCANNTQTHTICHNTHMFTRSNSGLRCGSCLVSFFLMTVSLPDLNVDSDDGDIDPTPPVVDATGILSEKFADTIFGCALVSVNFLVDVGICMCPLVCDHGCSWRATFPASGTWPFKFMLSGVPTC